MSKYEHYGTYNFLLILAPRTNVSVYLRASKIEMLKLTRMRVT